MKYDIIFRYKGDSFDKYDTSLLLPNAKTIYQFTVYGEFINKYMCASEAVRLLNLNVDSSSLTKAARSNKVSCGYLWSYTKEFDYDINNYKNYISVDKYSLNGKFIKNYEYAIDVRKDLNVKRCKISHIIDVCSGKLLYAYDFVWRYKGEAFDKHRLLPKTRRIPVNEYSKQGDFLANFDSISIAGNSMNVKDGGSEIIKCCKGKMKTAYGYKWFYANDPNQPDKSKIIA